MLMTRSRPGLLRLLAAVAIVAFNGGMHGDICTLGAGLAFTRALPVDSPRSESEPYTAVSIEAPVHQPPAAGHTAQLRAMPAAATASLLQRILHRMFRGPTVPEGYQYSAPTSTGGQHDAHDRKYGPEEHEVDEHQLQAEDRDGAVTADAVVVLDALPLAEANGMLARWANRKLLHACHRARCVTTSYDIL